MTRFRIWLALLICWLAVFFNLERLHEPINIASFVYVLAGIMAAVVVVTPPMSKVTLGTLAVATVATLLFLKTLLGYDIAGTSLPLTITEAAGLLITVGLAHQIARRARRFEVSAAEVATARWLNRPASFDDGQAEMYRELKRARQHDRPLSVVVLEPSSESLNVNVDRLIQEVRQEMIRRYVEARMVDSVKQEVQDFDLVNYCDGRFILMLPETEGGKAIDVGRRVAQRVQEELGLELNTGSAAFPADEVTLTGLVERAESALYDRIDRNVELAPTHAGASYASMN